MKMTCGILVNTLLFASITYLGAFSLTMGASPGYMEADAKLVDGITASFPPFFNVRTTNSGIRKLPPFTDMSGIGLPFQATRFFWTLVPSWWVKKSGLRVGSNQFEGEVCLFHKDGSKRTNVEIAKGEWFSAFPFLASETHEGFVIFYQTNIYSRIIIGAVMNKARKECSGCTSTFSNDIKTVVPELTEYFKKLVNEGIGRKDEGAFLLKMLSNENEMDALRACAIFLATDAKPLQYKQAIRGIASRDSTSPLVRCAAFASLYILADADDIEFMEMWATKAPLLSY